ncbi:hypothetical protein GCM10009665_33500 [Kitasatospora nipponensis]|uniref:Uncharacterized protein n=1 Tax=Kitasatospora nipponensis TaxID=258049 RepID=A0ABN1W855_9ACTN
MVASKRIRMVGWAGAVLSLLVGGVCTDAAGAATGTGTKVTAPYAQAAAVVNSDGSINRSKGIAGVTKPAVGRYCVELEDKSLDVTRLVPVATLQYTAFEYNIRISMWPDPVCGTRTDTFLVITGKPGVWEDQAFSIVIP